MPSIFFMQQSPYRYKSLFSVNEFVLYGNPIWVK